MKTKILGFVVAGLMLAAAPVQAAVFNVAGGTSTTINAVADAPFDNVGTGLNPASSPIQFFDNASTGSPGLTLSEGAKVTFEFLGKEAEFLNTFNVLGNTFTNGTTAPGASFTVDLAGGAVPFTFTSVGIGRTAINNGTIDSPLAFAIALLNPSTAILLFDDSGSNVDLDDMAVKVSVSQVPLPAAAWLLISAILGLVSFSRIRRSGAQTA